MAIYDRLYNKYLQQLHQAQLAEPNMYRELTPPQFLGYYANAAKKFKEGGSNWTKGHPKYEYALIRRVLFDSGYNGYSVKLAKAAGVANPLKRQIVQFPVNERGVDPNVALAPESRELSRTTTSFNEVKREVTPLSPVEWKMRVDEGYSNKEIIEQSYAVPTSYIKSVQRMLKDVQRDMIFTGDISEQYDIKGIMEFASFKLGRHVTTQDFLKNPSLAYYFVTTITPGEIMAMSLAEIRGLIALLRSMGYTQKQINEILSPEED